MTQLVQFKWSRRCHVYVFPDAKLSWRERRGRRQKWKKGQNILIAATLEITPKRIFVFKMTIPHELSLHTVSRLLLCMEERTDIWSTRGQPRGFVVREQQKRLVVVLTVCPPALHPCSCMTQIPMILEALKREEDFRLFVSPWSPPAWMKVCTTVNSMSFVIAVIQGIFFFRFLFHCFFFFFFFVCLILYYYFTRCKSPLSMKPFCVHDLIFYNAVCLSSSIRLYSLLSNSLFMRPFFHCC